jgi:hypothetical protein
MAPLPDTEVPAPAEPAPADPEVLPVAEPDEPAPADPEVVPVAEPDVPAPAEPEVLPVAEPDGDVPVPLERSVSGFISLPLCAPVPAFAGSSVVTDAVHAGAERRVAIAPAIIRLRSDSFIACSW